MSVLVCMLDVSLQDLVNSLHIASYEGFNEMVRYLTSMKANANVADCVRNLSLLTYILTSPHAFIYIIVWSDSFNDGD